MTKKELSQLYNLKKEIKLLKRQEQDIESTLENITSGALVGDTVQGSCTSFPFVKHAICIAGLKNLGEAAAYSCKSELADIKTLISLNEEKCIYEYNRLMRYIAGIESSEIRQIMTLYFVEGKTWQQVANHLGNEVTGDAARVKVSRYLNILEKN